MKRTLFTPGVWLLLNCLRWLSLYFWEQIKAAIHREAKRLVLILALSHGHQQRGSMQVGLFFLLQNLASKQRKLQGGKIAQPIVKCLPCKYSDLSWILRTFMEEEEEEKKKEKEEEEMREKRRK